jgi:microcystin-dependent protein
MAEPFMAEIRMMSFNFPPKGWALANGQLLPINQNQALFSLLGTTYGGDGRQSFGLPNLQGAVPVHMGTGFPIGQKMGEPTHTLSQGEMPKHVHLLQGTSNTANTPLPENAMLATTPNVVYSTGASSNTNFKTTSVSSVGGSQPHENRMPSAVISFCVALQGLFPSRT